MINKIISLISFRPIQFVGMMENSFHTFVFKVTQNLANIMNSFYFTTMKLLRSKIRSFDPCKNHVSC